MKNIDKYPNTKDALDAYNNLKTKGVTFDEWIKCEYEETRRPSLLEAAEAVVLEASKVVTTVWFANNSLAEVLRKICDLSAVIECEKLKAALKPVLQGDCWIFETDKSRAIDGAEDAIKAVNEAKRVYKEVKE